ncbi:YggS family pyridoxal phosphate-dependent enzyme [Ammoniphilus resinae]|uniref:Pyridoxal phosphate homeostasis protein n=1 Tax=Ammoniphilus resinae TaxID=861532 RepID=A0ABS4GK86_9BACL|nr:YggS family pyridoxal phosphate-dependent enzyme [Ammoniphilus resinae]MBP1930673.1 pyridoxal phosphate enzyme (YggS family) [Ammoniphilus resinae]
MQQKIRESIAEIQKRIEQASLRSNRNPSEIKIVAVTKYSTLETTKAVLDEGLIHIGESKVQDVIPKLNMLGDRGIWHFIGHLQTNKVKDVVGHFRYIHSLDRISLAKEIEKWGKKKEVKTNCFVQVNVSGEESKFGLKPKEVLEFVKETSKMEYITICGLMTMAPFESNPEDTRPIFQKLRELQEEVKSLQLPHAPAQDLSMGMSNDFEVAIEEGATFIRLGTILVGQELKPTH